jgi:flagellar biosynthesis/type III secretory pathway protein FliH
MSSKVVKTMRQLRVPDAHRIEVEAAPWPTRETELMMRKIVDEAEQEAAAVLSAAHMQAEALWEEARQRGTEEGRKAGFELGVSEVRQEWQTVRERALEIVSLFEEMSAWQQLAAGEHVATVAKAMAGAVLRLATAEHPAWFSEYLGRVAAELDAKTVRLAVGEAWADFLDDIARDLRAVVQVTESWVDRSLPPFEVRIASEGLELLAGIETALTQMLEAMRYGEPTS